MQKVHHRIYRFCGYCLDHEGLGRFVDRWPLFRAGGSRAEGQRRRADEDGSAGSSNRGAVPGRPYAGARRAWL